MESTVKYSQSEHSEQVRLINWVRANQSADPRLGLLFAVPNGGTRSAPEARKLKAEGVLAGVPDLCLPVPVGEQHGLFIELKTMKGRASASQKAMIARLNDQGYRAEVCQGHEAAIAVIQDYLGDQNES